jgi:heme-degrading monooxygenase HmoA
MKDTRREREMFYLINKFTVTGDADEFHRVILQVNKYMSAQPGFRWHRLYQSVTDPNVYIETA